MPSFAGLSWSFPRKSLSRNGQKITSLLVRTSQQGNGAYNVNKFKQINKLVHWSGFNLFHIIIQSFTLPIHVEVKQTLTRQSGDAYYIIFSFLQIRDDCGSGF